MAKLNIYQCFSYKVGCDEVLECQCLAKNKKEFYEILKKSYDIKWNEKFEGENVYVISKLKFDGYKIDIKEA